MWTTIISTVAMVVFIFIARSWFATSNTMGDGGMAAAILGYGSVLFACIASIILVYKASLFGLDG